MRKVPAYRSPLLTHLGLETRSTMRLGTSYRLWRNIYISTNTLETVSPRLLGISNGNTMIFWLRSLASSVTPDSVTTASMLSSTSSLPLAMGELIPVLLARLQWLMVSYSLRELDIELMK